MFKRFLAIGFLLLIPLTALAQDRDAVIDAMEARQREVAAILQALERRIAAMDIPDASIGILGADEGEGRALKEAIDDLLDTAKSKVNAFTGMDAEDHLGDDEAGPDSAFSENEVAALEAINAVNRFLISPTRPGQVPEGDIIEDFIPRTIQLLFRFASVAFLVMMVVSGVMMVISYDNEERVTKAKTMLYWSLVGFAFIVMAFALVRAVTNITFF